MVGKSIFRSISSISGINPEKDPSCFLFSDKDPALLSHHSVGRGCSLRSIFLFFFFPTQQVHPKALIERAEEASADQGLKGPSDRRLTNETICSILSLFTTLSIIGGVDWRRGKGGGR